LGKVKTAFFCQNCGAQSPKWIGKCPSCFEWNTYVEEVIEKPQVVAAGYKKQSSVAASKPKMIGDISTKESPRYLTEISELDRVLGGGVVSGSVMLIGGEPGIGKSTLMLQLALKAQNTKTLYISGEESEVQIKMRAERLGLNNSKCIIYTETDTKNIFHYLNDIQPSIVIVDSIQAMISPSVESSAGSVSQIRESASEYISYAKETGIPVFIVGHITKEGSLAGPKVLEHMVDTVLVFEGDSNHIYRILRATKNRYGSTSELGIFQMQSDGLCEVSNPSEMLISYHDEFLSGVAVSATIEGIRPLMIETQALVSSAVYGTPQRSSTGFDIRRLNMLLAVLEKRCGFKIGAKDVFLNIAGGIKVNDPATDLGIICSILSSNEDTPVKPNVCFASEIGLSGELRPVTRIEQRISESEKLGFNEIYVSKHNFRNSHDMPENIKVVACSKIEEVFNRLFG